MNAAALIVNFALFVVSAGAAAVAWWKAIASSRSEIDAKGARDEAIRIASESKAALDVLPRQVS